MKSTLIWFIAFATRLGYGLWWQEQKQLDNPRALLNHPLPCSYPSVYISNCFNPLLHSSRNSQVLRWNLPEPYLSRIPTQSPHFSIP
ncbi:hypothetical protein L2E82_33476 [Cichorium intybus]|uniref:Uncharacterized protein n=1 Tax=Cichorium intybus TaxID=13427 RepID=A0ACB9BKI8_CICIN|nr:hypothetical protein L2E82_33476 [Cichorium intybus]